MAKSNPRLLSEDIIKYVSQQSSLNQKQVEECFDAYSRIILSLCLSEDRPTNMTISMPKLGVFKFVTIKGRKKEGNYKVPSKKNGVYQKMENLNMKHDELDYERIKFKIFDKFQKGTREMTENKKLKDLSFNFNFNEEG